MFYVFYEIMFILKSFFLSYIILMANQFYPIVIEYVMHAKITLCLFEIHVCMNRITAVSYFVDLSVKVKKIDVIRPSG